MVFGYLLLVLIPVAAIAYIVWDHKRKAADRDAASAGRLHELLGTAVVPQRPGAAEPPATQPTPATPATSPTHSGTAPAPLYASRGRVLNPPQTLLYYLLKTGLPDHVVFARVTLASVLEAGAGLSGFAREEQIRRLSALTVDFVVLDKSMRPLTVVELSSRDQGSTAEADRASARTRLAAAGVRYLELDATALPRKDAIRMLVLGEEPAGGTDRAVQAGVAS